MKSGKTLVELATEIERRKAAKQDLVANTANMSVRPFGGENGGVLLAVADRDFGINDVAHDQIAQYTDIPKKYYDKMRTEAPDLLANNINTWFAKHPAVRMARTMFGTTRAFLSDRYRPLENEDLAEAVLPVIGDMGLDLMSCEVTDRRLYIKAVDPKVQRELAKTGARFGDGGHTIVRVTSPAITISNSEVGMGALNIQAGVFDSFCSNLATFGERSLRKYHVGGKHELVDEQMFALLSDETRQKTDAALWAQVRDVVKIAFDKARFDDLVDKIEGSQQDKLDKEADVVKVVNLTSKRLGLNESEGKSVLAHLIQGGDLSRFGLYNAVTRTSQDVESYDRATELERAGAAVIELPKSDWRELAMAA